MPDLAPFRDSEDCHWTYRLGRYESFLNWRSREDVEAVLEESTLAHGPEIFVRHGKDCGCHDGTDPD